MDEPAAPVRRRGLFGRMERMPTESEADNKFTEAALERHKREGMELAIRARWIALAVIGIMLPFINPSLEDKIQVTVIATGFSAEHEGVQATAHEPVGTAAPSPEPEAASETRRVMRCRAMSKVLAATPVCSAAKRSFCSSPT